MSSRRDKARLQRILDGSELSISEKNAMDKGNINASGDTVLYCKLCFKTNIPESEARAHIRECWNVNIKDGDSIPSEPPKDLMAREANIKRLRGYGGLKVVKK